MSKGDFTDHTIALRMRDLIRKMVKAEVAALRPDDRFGEVVDIDWDSLKCTVLMTGAEEPVTVPFPTNCQPSNPGQVVRISGNRTSRWISAVSDPPTWTAPASYTNSWVAFGGSTYEQPGYMRDSLGAVWLKGTMKNGTNGASAFTLPVGYRPALRRIRTCVQGDSVVKRLDIYADGSVVPVTVTDNTFVTLDDISFPAA